MPLEEQVHVVADAAAHVGGYQTLARMQARDEPVVAHFVGGESKPWYFMVLRFQNLADRIPAGLRLVLHAWETMYWLAKTNRICHGAVTEEERLSGQQLLALDPAAVRRS